MGSIGGTNAVIEEPIPVRPVPRFLSQFLCCSWESTGEGKGNVVVREKSAEEQQEFITSRIILESSTGNRHRGY